MVIKCLQFAIVISLINLTFLAMLLRIYLKDKNRFPGLKKWLGANGVLTMGIIFTMGSSYIENEGLNYVFIFVGYVITIVGIIFVNKFLFNLMMTKDIHTWRNLLAVFFLLSLTSYFLDNKDIFAFTYLFILLYYILCPVITINAKGKKEDRSLWLSFTVMQSIGVSFVVGGIGAELFNGYQLSELFVFNNGISFAIFLVIAITFFYLVGIFTTLNNITPHKIDLENNLFRTIFNFTPNMIVIFDKHARKISYINQHFIDTFGYTSREVIKKMRFQQLFDSLNDYERLKKEYHESNTILKEYRVKMRYKNKKVAVCLIAITPIPFNDDEYYLASIVDITSTISESEKFEYLATYDELTSLPNRRPLFEVFKYKKTNSKSFVLMLLDIDNFKEINDSFGHNVGDEVLKILAPRFNRFNKDNDIAARYGGDEFIFIIDINKKQGFKEIVNQFKNILEEDIIVKNNKVSVEVSIGISEFPSNGLTYEELLEKADMALYKAKSIKGINTIVLYDEIEKEKRLL
ncbi:MAG: sensor domain-containing diguanylate cyclase [Acholeplasma sp.]|nr:sensor domain-containing diguanylate cyclase [Acholeplasma sp.]